MLLVFSGDRYVNGVSDPTSLYTLLKWREANRNGEEVRRTMCKLEPQPWKGIMENMEHMQSQQASATASREDAPLPSAAKQRRWANICNSAADALDTISTYISNYGIIQNIIMRDRWDLRLTQRTFQQERTNWQETYWILKRVTGGDFEAKQALLRLF